MPLHHIPDKRRRSVEKRDVVRMARYTARVKGDDDIDAGLGGSGRRCVRQVRSEQPREQTPDRLGVPGDRHGIRELLILDHDDVVFRFDAELESALFELALADVAQAVCVAGAEAEDDELVLQLRFHEPLDRGSEKHRLIVWVGDEEQDAFAAQGWVGLDYPDGEEPECDDENGDLGGCEPVHRVGGLSLEGFLGGLMVFPPSLLSRHRFIGGLLRRVREIRNYWSMDFCFWP